MRHLAFAILAALPAAAQADALLDQALANGGAYDPQDWAYVSTMKVWTGGSTVVGDALDRLSEGRRARPPLRTERVTQYDPSKPAGQRQRVIRDTGAGKDAAVQIDTDEHDDAPAYSELRKLVQSAPKLVASTATTATYRALIDPAAVKTFGSADIDIDSDTKLPPLVGTFTVLKTGPRAPYVSTVVVALPTGDGGRGNAAGKVRQLSLGFRYAPDPKRGVQLLRAFGFDTSLQGLGLVTVDFSVLNSIMAYRYTGK